MNDNIIEIKNLKCKYSKNIHPILEIESLNIRRGSKVFFIGPSGVGKSTILETLGIMNNTIYEPIPNNTIFIFKYQNNGDVKSQEIIDLWNSKEKTIANFRKGKLSFIFQNTNLFDSISPLDNVSLAPILQGYNRDKAVKRTNNIIPKLFLDKEISEIKGKRIQELSGGQRQRIAFARSIAIDYQILFADEPTGNLDSGNAEALMELLVNELSKPNDYLKTAVFVTHDINLSIKYADQIVIINRKKRNDNEDNHQNYYGFIDKSSVYSKIKDEDSWQGNGRKISGSELEKLLYNSIKINK